jgi:hypothetical protein
VNASATGLLIHVNPQNLNPEMLQHNLPFESVEGDYVTMKIVEMELEIGMCPTFYTLCTALILGPFSTNSAMSKERYLIA